MRDTNKNLVKCLYNGKYDLGGNKQNKSYFKPFNTSKNLQLHGKVPSPNNNFVGK